MQMCEVQLRAGSFTAYQLAAVFPPWRNEKLVTFYWILYHFKGKSFDLMTRSTALPDQLKLIKCFKSYRSLHNWSLSAWDESNVGKLRQRCPFDKIRPKVSGAERGTRSIRQESCVVRSETRCLSPGVTKVHEQYSSAADKSNRLQLSTSRVNILAVNSFF